jgi:hypothetical protein
MGLIGPGDRAVEFARRDDKGRRGPAAHNLRLQSAARAARTIREISPHVIRPGVGYFLIKFSIRPHFVCDPAAPVEE